MISISGTLDGDSWRRCAGLRALDYYGVKYATTYFCNGVGPKELVALPLPGLRTSPAFSMCHGVPVALFIISIIMICKHEPIGRCSERFRKWLLPPSKRSPRSCAVRFLIFKFASSAPPMGSDYYYFINNLPVLRERNRLSPPGFP